MGNELIFEGKKYISPKRASQITGYNSDYIGQLCRKGALECKLVGRSWFVEEKSLSEHEVVASKTPRGRIPNYAKGSAIPNQAKFEAKRTENAPVVKNVISGDVISKSPAVAQAVDLVHDLAQSEEVIPAYDHTPFVNFSHESVSDTAFTRKIVAVCAAIILCVFGAPFLLRENNVSRIDVALRVSGTIAQEINSNTSKQMASVSSSFKNAGLTLAAKSDGIHEFRIKTHKFTLKTYHVISLLPSMFFDTAHNMKRIVMRDGEKISSDGQNGQQALIDNGSVTPGVRSGITVVPSTGDQVKDEKLKQYIKDSFSDEIKVVPDNTGTSGVIKPIFKKQSDQDYIYVIVPTKQ